MRRIPIYSLLTALLAGCVVVPLNNGYDGHHDSGDYRYNGGFRNSDHGGWPLGT